MMEDLIFARGNRTPVYYRFRKGRSDCNHLLIVMSGFNIPDPTIYDFDKILEYCDSHILWVKDEYNGLPAYYFCNNMSFDIELGVSTLIEGVRKFLNDPTVSILGASKGGSASLYYGIKHKIPRIITAVPQFNIGTYVAEGTYWQHVGKEMMGEFSQENINRLNNKLPNILKMNEFTNNHIYLFTSPTDAQFQNEIQPNLSLFSRYKNFNLIISKSPKITQHNQVTLYNVKLILSLLYQFESGINPLWGNIRNGSDWN
ncbi:TPA: hypothetical protein ACIPUI_001141 [Citrobacter freundii]